MNRKIKDKISIEQKRQYGDRIRALRNAKALTLEQFAEPLPVGFKTVSSYENGNSVASEAVVRELERIYLMSRKWYESGEGSMIRESVKYDDSDHEEDNSRRKPVTSDAGEQFSGLRFDQIDLLKKWDKIKDCRKRCAILALMDSMEEG